MPKVKLDDPDLPLLNLINEWPQTIPVFLLHKMLCVGCMVSRFHTVMDVCAAYGLDADEFYSELAAALIPVRRII